jgi:hypothetical protein
VPNFALFIVRTVPLLEWVEAVAAIATPTPATATRTIGTPHRIIRPRILTPFLGKTCS